MPVITETAESGTQFFNITQPELIARLSGLGGHDVPLDSGAYGHITHRHEQTRVSIHLYGPNNCQGCGATLWLSPDLDLTEEQLMDPDFPLPFEVSRFDAATRTTTVIQQCPAATPEHYSVEIDIPSGELLIRNLLTRDKSSPLHYAPEYESDKDINFASGRRYRTRVCAEELGYGIVSTTDSPDIWQLADDALQIGGPGCIDGDEYGRYEGDDDEWIPMDRPGTLLGQTCLDVWSIEMMDLAKFTAAGGQLNRDYDEIIARLRPGRYRLTVLNEAYEKYMAEFPANIDQPRPDATVARLERIGSTTAP